MCIMYDERVTKRTRARTVDSFVMYKVYVKFRSYVDGKTQWYLRSPFYSQLRSGCIMQPGVHKAFNKWAADKRDAISFNGDYDAGGKKVYYTRRNIPTGMQLDVYGIHCFFKRSDAVEMAGRTSGRVVVRVHVRSKDLIIGGYENLDHGVVPTATFRRIRIDKRDFDKATR